MAAHRSALATTLVLAGSLACLTISSFAQADISVCNAALAKDVATTVHSQEEDLDFISVVDQHTYDEAHGKGSFGATVPYADALLKLSGDWEAFKKNRTDYFNAIGYKSHYKEGDFAHYELTSALAYPAWSHCIELLAAQRGGLYAWKDHEDENAVVLTISYKVPESTIRKLKTVPLTGTVKFGDSNPIPLFDKNEKISSEQSKSKIISRPKVKDMPQNVLASLNAGKERATVVSVWRPEPPPPTYVKETQHMSSDVAVGLFHMRFLAKEGEFAIIGTDLNVSGPITSVVCKGATGIGSDHIWYVGGNPENPGHNVYAPSKKSVLAVVATNHGPPNEPTVFFTVNFDVDVLTCIGRDKMPHGLGCPVRSPFDVLGQKMQLQSVF
ncbi:MAG: hypothetical protein DMG96_33485 [Acidobacteria bacterium]|nr:MAG: hypothetical protein DMG96_33485 [Acidobacteriota bacterium]